MLFFLYNSVATAKSSRHVGDTPELDEVESQSYESTITNHTAKMIDKPRSIHAINQLEDKEPNPTSYHVYDADLWCVKQVTRHRWKHNEFMVELKSRSISMNQKRHPWE